MHTHDIIIIIVPMPVVDFNTQTEGKLNSMVLTPVFTNKPSSPSLHPHSSLSRTLLQADVATWIVVCYSSTAQQRQTSQCSSPVFHTAQYATNVQNVFQINANTCFCFQLDAFVNLFILLCIHLRVFYSVSVFISVFLHVYVCFMIFSWLLFCLFFFNCLSPMQQLWEQRCCHHSCLILFVQNYSHLT